MNSLHGSVDIKNCERFSGRARLSISTVSAAPVTLRSSLSALHTGEDHTVSGSHAADRLSMTCAHMRIMQRMTASAAFIGMQNTG